MRCVVSCVLRVAIGVASLAACCSTLIRFFVSNCTCLWYLSFIDSFAFSYTICRTVFQFVFALCKRAVGFRITTAVLIVAVIGEWSEVRP
jgi:hypothetical protein